MTGIGRSHGAISILNGIPCGIGASMAIEMDMKAAFSVGEKGANDPLVDLCVRKTLESIREDVDIDYSVKIETDIPPSVGLKSSSAVANAVIRAVLDEYSKSMMDDDIHWINAICGKESGKSITGAYDDACATDGIGISICDNTEMELLDTVRLDEAYDVILCLPEKQIQKSEVDVGRYEALGKRYKKLSRDIKRDPFMVMTENGRCVADIVGEGNGLIDLALDNGALGAGVTGTGPAVAIVTYKGDYREIEKALDCRFIRTRAIP